MMYAIIRRFLFFLNAENAHNWTLFILDILVRIRGIDYLLKKWYHIQDPRLKKTVAGITFENPVGLAAGFDKNGKHIDTMAHLGFGFIEVGTVTPLPQAGNPRPRLFRLPSDKAVINRMGFNNEGLTALLQRLRTRKNKTIVIGGNIGKNKITPNAHAIKDYVTCFETLYPYVDYFAVNVSSPNTPGLRELQEKKPLTDLLMALQQLNEKTSKPKPIFLKIAPDLTDNQLDDIIEIVLSCRISGIIATNTTLDRSELISDTTDIGAGGLSGAPLRQRSTEVISYLSSKSNQAFPIIAVGGIDSAEAAIEKLKAGASLVQIYTGLIYKGPALIKQINCRILKEKSSNNHEQ